MDNREIPDVTRVPGSRCPLMSSCILPYTFQGFESLAVNSSVCSSHGRRWSSLAKKEDLIRSPE